MIQLDFFSSDSDRDLFEIKKEMARIEESANKVRRGTYASINKIGKEFCAQEQRISILEHQLYVLEKYIKERLNDKQ